MSIIQLSYTLGVGELAIVVISFLAFLTNLALLLSMIKQLRLYNKYENDSRVLSLYEKLFVDPDLYEVAVEPMEKASKLPEGPFDIPVKVRETLNRLNNISIVMSTISAPEVYKIQFRKILKAICENDVFTRSMIILRAYFLIKSSGESVNPYIPLQEYIRKHDISENWRDMR